MEPRQEQQQQQLHNEEDVLESYYDAQRAGAEAIDVGRATLEQASRQGEQLDRTESMADETQYTLDKAGRLLRGMTWSGWVANMFTHDVAMAPATGTARRRQRREPPLVYDDRPESCRGVVQAVQNYHANVNVLTACETSEQRDTCRTICDVMYDGAVAQLEGLKSGPDGKQVVAYIVEFEQDLTILRERQKKCQQLRGARVVTAPQLGAGESSEGGGLKQGPSPGSTQGIVDVVKQRQDEHLDVLAQNLDELGSIAGTLQEAVGHQNQTMNRLETKSETILEQSKRVTRRADRLIQSKRWSTARSEFVCRVSIRNIETGRYLAVVQSDLYLVPRFSQACIFSMYKRTGQQASLFGLRSKVSDKWVGQSLFGALCCSATSYGRREEFEADEKKNWAKTTLLCASAGFGAGGYLTVRQRDNAVLIGSSGVEEKKKAALWCLEEVDVQGE